MADARVGEGAEQRLHRPGHVALDRVIVEAKAGEILGPTDKQQLLNYLRATNIEIGLLLHFGPDPRFLRCIHQNFIDSV